MCRGFELESYKPIILGIFFAVEFFGTLFNTASSASPNEYCVGEGWDRTRDCCDFGIGSQAL